MGTYWHCPLNWNWFLSYDFWFSDKGADIILDALTAIWYVSFSFCIVQNVCIFLRFNTLYQFFVPSASELTSLLASIDIYLIHCAVSDQFRFLFFVWDEIVRLKWMLQTNSTYLKLRSPLIRKNTLTQFIKQLSIFKVFFSLKANNGLLLWISMYLGLWIMRILFLRKWNVLMLKTIWCYNNKFMFCYRNQSSDGPPISQFARILAPSEQRDCLVAL